MGLYHRSLVLAPQLAAQLQEVDVGRFQFVDVETLGQFGAVGGQPRAQPTVADHLAGVGDNQSVFLFEVTVPG